MIKFKTTWTGTDILRRNVKSETETTVIEVGEKRPQQKRSRVVNWHDTWQEARDFLIQSRTAERDELQRKVDALNYNIAVLQAMSEPKE